LIEKEEENRGFRDLLVKSHWWKRGGALAKELPTTAPQGLKKPTDAAVDNSAGAAFGRGN
jgi:hypothetical protein